MVDSLDKVKMALSFKNTRLNLDTMLVLCNLEEFKWKIMWSNERCTVYDMLFQVIFQHEMLTGVNMINSACFAVSFGV